MPKLIVAEKPSVARSIAGVVGATSYGDGYTEGGGYIVTWCFGHLVELQDAAEYDERYKRWDVRDLPIIPDPFEYKVTESGAKQFGVVSSLMRRADIDTVIEATDAGREGELIFRLVYNLARCDKPVLRLWVSSMEPSALAEAMSNLRPASDYDSLYESGLARQQADWLIGINLSRYYTAKCGTLLTAGRVQTPVLNLIVSRDKEIENFVPVPYYILAADLGGFTATHREEDKETADTVAAACTGGIARCTALEKKTVTDKPEKLYDLTTLQRDANRLFGYTAAETLEQLQGLYEAGLATYPRTDSRYLTSSQRESTLELLNTLYLAGLFPGTKLGFEPAIDRVIDDKKVSDHHAILPTTALTLPVLRSLADKARHIMQLVLWRLPIALAPDSHYESTSAKLDISGYEFAATGKRMIDFGYKAVVAALYDDIGKSASVRENILPEMAEGDEFAVISLETQEKFTTPPPSYTENTLLGAMETCGKDLDDESLREAMRGKGLGTPATRASIIEQLVKVGYIKRSKSKLVATEKGRTFIEMVWDRIKDPAMTADWEASLTDIAEGGYPSDMFMMQIHQFLETFLDEHRGDVLPQTLADNKPIGKCPKCGADVVETPKGYSCVAGRDKCGFVIWKEMCNKKIPLKEAEALLSTGHSGKISGFVSKAGKKFDAALKLRDDKSGVEFDFARGR